MRRRFDFEIGYLVKSPCKACFRYSLEFPQCAEHCATLDKIHAALTPAISCSCSYCAAESSVALYHGWNNE